MNIILLIFKDIGWFMIVLIVCIFAYANSFYIIAKNQVEFDNLEEDGEPSYHTFVGALQHVYLTALGEFGLDDYTLGDGSQEVVLWVLFISASFLLLIHLLNMLIAIMGESFAKNNETKSMQQLKSHLQFVMDNWWIDPIKDKESIKYLISAFIKEDEEEDVEILNAIKVQLNGLKTDIRVNNERMQTQMTALKEGS